MEIHLNSEFQQAWQNSDPFFKANQIQGKIFRQLEARKTIYFSHNNQPYFIKIHHGVGWAEIIKNLFTLRLPILGAKNEWLALNKLQKLDIDSLTPAAYGIRGTNPAKRESFLVTKALENTESLEDYCQNWSSNPPPWHLKQQLIKKIADITHCLHQHGLNHRDYYICHFLLDLASIDQIPHAPPTLYLIDLHRAQLRRKTPLRWQIKDVGSLYFSSLDIGLTKRDILRFMVQYSQKPLRQIIKDDKVFWQQVEKRAVTLYYKAFNRLPNLPL